MTTSSAVYLSAPRNVLKMLRLFSLRTALRFLFMSNCSSDGGNVSATFTARDLAGVCVCLCYIKKRARERENAREREKESFAARDLCVCVFLCF